jgi:molybdenum cofactor cytidylyltransferase
MGEFKQLLPLDGKTIIEWSADNLLASTVDEVLVVLGHRRNEVRNALGHRPIRFVINHEYQDGMSSSIKRAIEALPPETKAVLLALGDQPQIDPEVINKLIAIYESEKPLIVIPTNNGRSGHPIVLDLTLRDEILGMDPMKGLREVVHAKSDRAIRVEVETDAILLDLDWPEDYQRLSNTRS